MKIDPTSRDADRRYRLRHDPGPATYSVEGLASLVLLGKITPATEIAAEGTGHFQPIRAWPFADVLFPPKRQFEFRPGIPLKPFAPPPLEITGEEELREIMRRDPNDVRVTMLLNLIRGRAATENRPVAELLQEFFAQRRANLAGQPDPGPAPATKAPPVPLTPPPMKNVTPRPAKLGE